MHRIYLGKMAFQVATWFHADPRQCFGVLAGYLPHCQEPLSAQISTIEVKAVCQIGKTDYTYDDRFIRLLVRTACVREVVLLSLDPVFEAFRFPPCSRDFGLHLFRSHVVRHFESKSLRT